MIFKQNLVYFIANNTKYVLTILSRYKKIKSVQNRTGTNIEISTILVRMENFVFFYGFIKNYIPNRGCILNLEPREWDIFLGESPTRVHVVDFQWFYIHTVPDKEDGFLSVIPEDRTVITR